MLETSFIHEYELTNMIFQSTHFEKKIISTYGAALGGDLDEIHVFGPIWNIRGNAVKLEPSVNHYIYVCVMMLQKSLSKLANLHTIHAPT